MAAHCAIYVRLIEGTDCLVPVGARENTDGTFCVTAVPDFDAADSSTLFEFLPGDVVRVKLRALAPDRGLVRVATELVRSGAEDRDYWAVLFSIASGAARLPALEASALQAVASR